MKITINAQMENGVDLKNVLNLIINQYNDGVGSFVLPAQTKFGFDESGNRVSAKNPAAKIIVEMEA